jgi:hypothetical protein
MSSKIPESVMAQTTECTHKFSCLEKSNGERGTICKVDYADGKNVLFLVDRKSADCPYRMSYAERQVCRCPLGFFLHQQKSVNKK